MLEQTLTGERVLRGVGAAGGVAQARTLLLGGHGGEPPLKHLPEGGAPAELARLQAALVETRRQIQDVQRRVAAAVGTDEAALFDAHLLAIDDPTLLEQVTKLISSELVNAEHAFQRVANRYAAALDAVEDDYLRERAADVRDISNRVVNNLLGVSTEIDWGRIHEPVILIAHDLPPSVAAGLDRNKAAGVATDVGSPTSHMAIMARKLRIPCVVGLSTASADISSGCHALIDGHSGALIVNPTDGTLFQYGQIRERRAAFELRLRDLRRQPAVTLDGRRVELAANIDEPDDLDAVIEAGADGVGLFRTEFLFLRAADPPTEEEQYRAYRRVTEGCLPNAVVIRTLDLGGDKFFGGGAPEANPFLGWRAIRMCLDRRDLFRTQLRAILRASAHGRVRLMYPMISGLDEVVQANALLDRCRGELRSEGLAFNQNLEVGLMVEVPSAAIIAERLAPHADFFSLGTNDLTQYTLAADRLNERVSHLHDAAHPAVLRLAQITVAAARSCGRWVGACGEAAGDPALIPLWIGLGLDEISATPPSLPEAKFLLRRLKLGEARALAEEALNCSTAAEVRARSLAVARAAAPELFDQG